MENLTELLELLKTSPTVSQGFRFAQEIMDFVTEKEIKVPVLHIGLMIALRELSEQFNNDGFNGKQWLEDFATSLTSDSKSLALLTIIAHTDSQETLRTIN